MKGCRIKIFSNCFYDDLGKEANDFIRNKDIVDMQFSTSVKPSGIMVYSVMIVYREREEN